MKGNVCIYCSAKAVRWCDFVIGFTDPDGDGLYSSTDNSEILRCDAPLCAEHSVNQGWLHIKAPKPIGGFDTVDHCCTHDWADENWSAIQVGEAERVRYRHRCLAVPGLQPVRGKTTFSRSQQ